MSKYLIFWISASMITLCTFSSIFNLLYNASTKYSIEIKSNNGNFSLAILKEKKKSLAYRIVLCCKKNALQNLLNFSCTETVAELLLKMAEHLK